MSDLHRSAEATQGQNMNSTKIDSLIAELGCKDEIRRSKARQALIVMGDVAIESLVKALSSRNESIRWQVTKILDQINIVWAHHADATTVNTLIEDLLSEDGLVRVKAREALIHIGKPAVISLTKVMSSKKEWMRWEATKALGQIGDPAAMEALINALEDEMFDVRWLAAEGLIKIGNKAIPPLLERLIDQPESIWLREGVHHVLHDLNRADLKDTIQPVITALESIDPSLEVVFAAKKVLETYRG